MSLTEREVSKRKTEIRLRFYTVIINGAEYWATGKSIEKVSKQYGVSIGEVTIGADTINLPHAGSAA